MGILDSLKVLNVTEMCLYDIMEEIINEISDKKIGDNVAGISKYIEYLRDQVEQIKDKEEKEQAKTEVVRYEHKINPQINRITNKVVKRKKNENN